MLIASLIFILNHCPVTNIYRGEAPITVADLSYRERLAYNGALIRCGFIYGHSKGCLEEFKIIGPDNYRTVCSGD